MAAWLSRPSLGYIVRFCRGCLHSYLSLLEKSFLLDLLHRPALLQDQYNNMSHLIKASRPLMRATNTRSFSIAIPARKAGEVLWSPKPRGFLAEYVIPIILRPHSPGIYNVNVNHDVNDVTQQGWTPSRMGLTNNAESTTHRNPSGKPSQPGRRARKRPIS